MNREALFWPILVTSLIALLGGMLLSEDRVGYQARVVPLVLIGTSTIWVLILLLKRDISSRWIAKFQISLLLFSLTLYLLLVNRWVSIVGDNIGYIGAAQGLIAGKGLYNMASPVPVPDLQYGFGLPVMLVPLIYFFDSVVAMKLVPVFCAALASAAIFLMMRKYAEGKYAAVISFLCAVNPLVWDYAHQIMTETPFLFFSATALFLVVKYGEQPKVGGKYLYLAAVSLGWLYHVKGLGILLLIASGAYLFLRREWKRAVLLVGVAGATIVPWMIRNAMLNPHPAGGIPYLSNFLVQMQMEDASKSLLANILNRFLSNLDVQFGATAEMIFPISFYGRKWVVPALVLIGYLHRLFRNQASAVKRFEGKTPSRSPRSKSPIRRSLRLGARLDLIEIYFALVFGAILIWPGAPSRYLIYVMPFLFFYFITGCVVVAGFVVEKLERQPSLGLVRSVVFVAVVLVVSIPDLWADMEKIEFQRWQNGYGGPWTNYYKTAMWLKANTPPDATVVARKPGLIYMWSGRRGSVYPYTSDAQEMMAFFEKYDYVIADGFWEVGVFRETPRYLIPVIQEHSDRFEVAYKTDPPRNWVLRLKK